jgi:hypothetical protein
MEVLQEATSHSTVLFGAFTVINNGDASDNGTVTLNELALFGFRLLASGRRPIAAQSSGWQPTAIWEG